MSPARTPKSHTEAANAVVGETLRAYKLDTGYSYAQLAADVGRDKSLVEDWAKGAKPAPLFLLTHPLVPERLRERLRALCVASESPSVPVERTSSLLVGAAASAIGAIAAALADGVMTAEERIACAPAVRDLRDRCDQWLKRHGGEQ